MQENLTQETVKNSFFNLLSTVLSKIGGFIFVIIIARALTPELFGIYNIVFSIVSFVLTLTGLGLGDAFVRYASDLLGKNKRDKAKKYSAYLIKLRSLLVLFLIFLIVVFGRTISDKIFNKPLIYFPLLISCFYVFFKAIESLIRNLFTSLKHFEKISVMDFFLQFFRIVFVLIVVFLIKEPSVSRVSAIFIALTLAVLLSIISGILLLKKNRDFILNREIFNRTDLKKSEKRKVWNYIGFASLSVLSFKFFGIIDTFILGAFLKAEYIGYYSAALGLITSITALLGFGSITLFPIFTQIKSERIKRGLNQAIRYTLILSIPALFGILVLGKYFIIAFYGFDYAKAMYVLYSASFLILIYPLIGVYSPIFKAKDKVNELAKAGFISLGINILIDVLAVWLFMHKSQLIAISIAAAGTVLSRGFYLSVLVIKHKKIVDFKIGSSNIFKPVISALLMSLFLVAFNLFVDLNLLIGILEVLIGALIYFIFLYIMKGISYKDVAILKKLIKK